MYAPTPPQQQPRRPGERLHPAQQSKSTRAATSSPSAGGGTSHIPPTRSSVVSTTTQPPVTVQVGHKVRKGKLDLRKLDGKETRQIDKATGGTVERRYKVLWDQRRPISKDELTAQHKLVKVTEDAFEVRQETVVVTEDLVHHMSVVPEKRRVEIDVKKNPAVFAALKTGRE